jgi:D-sedoheptulose 7-phosphate isomerase
MTDDTTGFLYPFIEADEKDPQALLVDLASSARDKAAISRDLQRSSLARMEADIVAAGRAMGERFIAGGRLYTFGNGGSSTDAATLAGLFCNPPAGRPVAAWSLTDDQAVVTALGNDVGFELIFSRQIIAHSTPGDVAIALSTSGNSDDLLRGLAEARKRGLLTIGFAGYDGGQMQASEELDHCFTVDSQSIHRIQESHAMIGHRLWSVAQETMRELRAARRSAPAAATEPPTREEVSR